MIRLIYAIPTWILFTGLYIILILAGWLAVPIAVVFKAYRETVGKHHFTWPIMYIWDNYEDGIAAGRQYKDYGALWKQIIYWSCLRNPVNNLRIVPILSCQIEPSKVRFVGSFTGQDIYKYDTKIPHWFFAWQGLYSNLYIHFMLGGKLRRLWIGWKIFPTDIYGVTPYRAKGAGFALQFKVVK